MASECIVFSDPRSTSLIQLATRTGEQSTLSEWTGSLRYAKLKVFSAQDRNSTASFEIISYNANDSIDNWMAPGIAVFVIQLNHIRFSGVISKVDGYYVGISQKQIYKISCESDANYLMNYTPQVKTGFIYKGQTPNTILTDLINPYNNWQLDAGGTFATDCVADFTITNKPMLIQVQDLAQLTGYKYRTRTTYVLSGITRSGTTITFAETNPDGFQNPPSGLAWGSHNKYILVVVGTQHNSAMSVTATNSGASQVTVTTTNAINPTQIATGKVCLLIEHPVLDFQKNFAQSMWQYSDFAATRKFFASPASDTHYTLTWDVNPASDKNDVITKVTANAIDVNGKPISIKMAAAFKYDPSDRKFFLQEAANKPYVDISYESNILWSDLTYTGGVYKGKIQVFSDMGISWGAGTYCYLCQTTGGLAEERAYIDSVNNTGEKINDRPTIYLVFSSAGLSYYYSKGDVVTWAELNYAYSKIHLSSTSGITDEAYYWIGSELVLVKDISSPNIYVARGRSFTSAKGYTVQTHAIAHKVGCPVMNGMPAASESTKCFDIDDYYNGAGTYDSPMKAYGLNTRQITANKAVDEGTLELIAYNVLSNKCVPKNKGSFSCTLKGLQGWRMSSTYIEPLYPGAKIQVDSFGTVEPGASTYYEIVSMDMDFDTGTAVVQVDEFDITLMQFLQQNSLTINIT